MSPSLGLERGSACQRPNAPKDLSPEMIMQLKALALFVASVTGLLASATWQEDTDLAVPNR